MLVTTEELIDYLGTDQDSEKIVEGCRASAIAYLRGATGRAWAEDCADQDVETANEVIRSRAWLSFHAMRGGVGNVEFIRQNVTALVKQLQYRGGSDDV